MTSAAGNDSQPPFFAVAPLMRVVLALMAGILLATYLPQPTFLKTFLWTLLGISLVLLYVSSRFRRTGLIFTLSLWLSLIVAGWQLTLLRAPRNPFPDQPQEALALLRLSDTPHATPRTFKVTADVIALRDSTGWHSSQGCIMLFFLHDSLSDTLRYGHTLLARLQPQLPPDRENLHQFDYRRYLYNKGILWQAFLDTGQWRLLSTERQGNPLIRVAKDLQLHLRKQLQATTLTPSQLGIAEALLLGWRDDLDDTTQRQFRNAGITHLLCVSGLHVGILAGFVGLLLFPLGRRRWARVIRGAIQLATIWLFVLLTGMAAPTLRAGVMFSLLVIGGREQGRVHSINTLAASALLLLCVRPTMLFETGFQLSYAALLGILVFMRPLSQLLPIPHGKPVWLLPERIWSLLCLTLSAQVAALPISIHCFHQFPTWFPVANLLIVPASGFLLVTVLLGALTRGAFFTRILDIELTLTDSLTRWVEHLPHAVIDNLYCDLPMTVLLLLSLFFLSLWWLRRRRWALPLMLLCWVAVAAQLRWADHRAATQNEVLFYHGNRHWGIEYFCGRESYLIADTLTARNPTQLNYQRNDELVYRRIRRTVVLPVDTCYADAHCVLRDHGFLFGRQRLFVVDHSNARPYRRYAPLPNMPPQPLHGLVVAPGAWVDSSHLSDAFHYDTIIML